MAEETKIAHQPPTGTKIVCEQAADGVTLTVPPAGIWNSQSRWVFLMGLVWLAFFGFLGAFLEAPLLLVAFYLLIGIAVLLFAINMGRRRAVLAVVGSRLLVMQSDLFGAKRREWDRAELKGVRAGPSGMEIGTDSNVQPVLELQILPRNGKAFALLGGRNEAELKWLANVLWRSLCQAKAVPTPELR